MDRYGQNSIEQLQFWCRLNKSPIFNKNYKQAEENEERLKAVERYPGRRARYRQRFNLPLPIIGQETKFRLTPYLSIEEVEIKDQTEKRTTTCAAEKSLWITQARSIEISDFLKQASKRKPIPKHDIRDSSTVQSPLQSPSPNRISDSSLWTSSETISPFPVFLKRQATNSEQSLFRRPTIEKALPLKTDDELFTLISKTIYLKPIPFKKTAEAYKFYETNFPLLLTTVTVDKDRCTTPSKRSRTPESPMSIMIARKRDLNQRLVDLESMMTDMEKETEDVKFMTELHDPLFDPTTWSWNQMDVATLRRRYTIDASLREM